MRGALTSARILGLLAQRERLFSPRHSHCSSSASSKARDENWWSVPTWSFALLAVPALATCDALGPETKEAGHPNFSGIWIRDDERTDLKAYEAQLEVMQITGVKKKTAMNFIEGLKLTEQENGVIVQFLTAVPFFKVTEEVSFVGPVNQSRRDKRSGSQRAIATRHATGMTVEMSWGEPLAGSLTEKYEFTPDTLIVNSNVTVRERSASARLIYKRNDKWRPKLSL